MATKKKQEPEVEQDAPVAFSVEYTPEGVVIEAKGLYDVNQAIAVRKALDDALVNYVR